MHNFHIDCINYVVFLVFEQYKKSSNQPCPLNDIEDAMIYGRYIIEKNIFLFPEEFDADNIIISIDGFNIKDDKYGEALISYKDKTTGLYLSQDVFIDEYCEVSSYERMY